MSIIIKGMDMPKDICGEPGYVDVRIFSDGSVIMAKAAPPYYGKFKAVPLPEKHGRLIDADALIDSFRESVQVCKKISEDGYADALQEVNERAIITTFIEAILRTRVQPTIVPAEGDDVDG